MRRRNPIRDETRARAHQLRSSLTEPERRLWRCLRNRRLAGLKFLRQVPIGPYIADFVCRECKLVVEVDGDSHADRAAYDFARQRAIEALGFVIARVSNDDVLKNLEGTLTVILIAAGIDIERWRSGEMGQIETGE